MRRSLTLLATSGLLPIVALGAIFGVITLRDQRVAVEERAQTDARFAAALVESRLDDTMHAVQMIAQSPALDGALDAARFRVVAGRIVAHQPTWRTISIATPEGMRLVDMPLPLGGRQGGPVEEPESLRRAVATGRPTIGIAALRVQGPAFAVRAPVIREGRIRYVVSAVIASGEMARLLRFQPLPDGWRAALIDQAGHEVASAGSPPAADRGPRPIETWVRVPSSGWSVRISTPAQLLSRPIRNAVLLLVLATLACALLFVVLARLLVGEMRLYQHQEAAALQSQRMEALGRLTGGVAHDFNNLLTPIMGGLDLLRRRVIDDPKALHYVDSALASAERAKTLLGRLLAFSRRQTLSPEPVDLAALIRGLSDLIARSLTPSIALDIQVRDWLPPVLVDPAQLELAIVNLAINARDAMPAGGAIRITAEPAGEEDIAGLPPGDYLRVTVSDTGTGMDEATLKQAIDPFFTTKPVEKGTGLGLSMVHGFAAQSGGALRLVSAPGQGTAASIVLPRSAAAAVATTPRAGAPAEPPRLPPGRILLVDDDPRVRRATAEILSEHNQQVVEVASVDEAMAALAGGARFDAVITDFVMPGRSGADLIQAARGLHPDLPVLLVTGYVSALDELPEDVIHIAKPFRGHELMDALARVRR
ncbi:hybrid sensor histidine kinase/response regulator [Sphingomonas morindae]|uniref:histidine kinase n=1 Tax=Sphingomonas morindae TaxID=1541170 RepID=A0ABY4X5A7_9SPHN|nr:ATP-binding protein [Sphingomonas morindae]USI72068.1 response regulator [Sphingomonas morindae]